MVTAHDIVDRLGGLAKTSELAFRGIDRRAAELAADTGRLLRVRKGWYALPELPPEVIRGIRIGGVVACVSAAETHGLWVPAHGGELHVVVQPGSARLRSPHDAGVRLAHRSDVHVHWGRTGSRTIQPIPELIALAARCQGHEAAFVLLESALHQGRLTIGERALVASLAPKGFRPVGRIASASSESGTESLMKLMLVRLGLPFRQQVSFAGVGRVDFVVGRNLAIEVDSRAHHSDPYPDRRRDAVLSARGIRVLRFEYRQIVFDGDQVEAAIVGAVARGDVAS